MARCASRCTTHALPRPVLTLQLGGLCNAFGNGIVLPFTLIYLHNVRGMSLSVAGLVLATNATVAMVSTPVGGRLVDRFGGRSILATALVLLLRRLRRISVRPRALAGVRRRHGDRPRERVVLAGAVDAARRVDAARPAPHHIRDAARDDEPGDRTRRARRRPHRDDGPSDLVHRSLRGRRGHVFASTSESCTRSCRRLTAVLGTQTRPRAATPMSSGTVPSCA